MIIDLLISILTVLSILTAVSSLTVVYPKVVLTVVFISTVVYIPIVVTSLSDYSPQHSPHSYFHVISISAYPAVRVKLYAYVKCLAEITYYFLERKAVVASLQQREWKKATQTTQMTALVKGSTC